MAVDKRGYVYRSERVDGRPRRVYVGKGPRAEQVDREIAGRRQARLELADMARRAAEERAGAEAALGAFSRALDGLIGVVLAEAGYHRHCRGNWRRKRRGKGRDAGDG